MKLSEIDDKTLSKVQAYSGMSFSLFLMTHLATQLSSHVSLELANKILASTRHIYQFPLIEATVIVASSATHITASVLRSKIRDRRSQQTQQEKQKNQVNVSQKDEEVEVPWDKKLHRTAGWFLIFFIPGHFAATRVATYLFVPFKLDWSAITFTLKYYGYLFFPYYAAAAFFGMYHMMYAYTRSLPQSGYVPKALLVRRETLRYMTWFIAPLVISGVLALAGTYYPININHEDFFLDFHPFKSK